jgi:hypothetical protein
MTTSAKARCHLLECFTGAMSTSYVEFRGRGFWSWDGYLEDVLRLLAETTTDDEDSAWLMTARRHWLTQASGAFSGWIHPKFDELLATEDRRQVFCDLAEAASRRDDLTPEARATLRLLIALIRGELGTDASSPVDYMVSREFPYRGPRRA